MHIKILYDKYLIRKFTLMTVRYKRFRMISVLIMN